MLIFVVFTQSRKGDNVMLAIERKNEIMNKLRLEQRVLVSELAIHYGVTEETIRRDLDKLENTTALKPHSKAFT